MASAYSKRSQENYNYCINAKNDDQQTVTIKESDHFMLTSELWDCEIRMLEASGFGDFIDNTDAVAVIKKYVASAHNEWCNLNCNEVTDQVLYYHCASHEKVIPHLSKLKGTKPSR